MTNPRFIDPRQAPAGDRGVVAVVVAVVVVVMLISLALVYDLGRAYLSRAQQQNAADAAALAGARDLSHASGTVAENTAREVAQLKYGFNQAGDVVTAVADLSNARELRIRVTVRRPIVLAFGALVGHSEPLLVTATAVANKIVTVPVGYAAYSDSDLTLKGGSSIQGSIYANHLIVKGTSDVVVTAPLGTQAFVDVRNGVTACAKPNQVIGNARTLLTSGAGATTDDCVSGVVHWAGSVDPYAFPTWTNAAAYAQSVVLLKSLIDTGDALLTAAPLSATGLHGTVYYSCSFPSKNPGTLANVEWIVCRDNKGVASTLNMDGTNLGWFTQSTLKGIVASEFRAAAPAGTYGVRPADGFHPVLIYLKGTGAQFQLTGTAQINGYLYVPNGSVTISATTNEKDATDATSNLTVNGRIIAGGSIKYSGQAWTIPDALIDQETAADPNPPGFTLRLIE